MTINEHIKYWVESADQDLDTSYTLLETGKYDGALFVGHLVVEKLLKAVYVQNNDNKIPLDLHNLVMLAEISNIDIDEDKKMVLDKINDFNIEVRYPEDKNEFYKICTKEFAEENMNKIKELYHWIKSQIK